MEKYIEAPYTRKGEPLKVSSALKKEILAKFKKVKKMKYTGINTIFSDIIKLEKMMREELKKDKN